MRHISFVCVSVLLAAAAFGQQGKPNFSGSWRLVADKSQVHPGKASVVAMTIEQKDSSIHVKKTIKGAGGDESTTEFTCTMDGNDCDAGGFKVNLFFDGRALVEMDFSDSAMSKTIMTLDDSNTICASVTYVAPKGEADTFTFDKM